MRFRRNHEQGPEPLIRNEDLPCDYFESFTRDPTLPPARWQGGRPGKPLTPEELATVVGPGDLAQDAKIQPVAQAVLDEILKHL
jgi:hypothetical protein